MEKTSTFRNIYKRYRCDGKAYMQYSLAKRNQILKLYNEETL